MSDAITLRTIREEAGLTQDALSERVRRLGGSISQARISEYEGGDKFPGPDNTKLLADALGVPVERLYSALLAQRVA